MHAVMGMSKSKSKSKSMKKVRVQVVNHDSKPRFWNKTL